MVKVRGPEFDILLFGVDGPGSVVWGVADGEVVSGSGTGEWGRGGGHAQCLNQNGRRRTFDPRRTPPPASPSPEARPTRCAAAHAPIREPTTRSRAGGGAAASWRGVAARGLSLRDEKRSWSSRAWTGIWRLRVILWSSRALI